MTMSLLRIVSCSGFLMHPGAFHVVHPLPVVDERTEHIPRGKKGCTREETDVPSTEQQHPGVVTRAS